MKIPEENNPARYIVNGVEKDYEAGATVTTDSSVNEIIEAGKSYPPAAPPVDQPFNPVIPNELPPVTEADNGKVLGVANGKWTAINADELPAIPDTDGTYTLQLAVSGDEAVLTWEAEGE